jgi:hypothetical protein
MCYVFFHVFITFNVSPVKDIKLSANKVETRQSLMPSTVAVLMS